jgi:predicted kinase
VASGSGQLARFKQMKKIDPLLIVFSGLSGAGKTTIAKAFAAKHSAVYVRVDEIEHALKQLSISQDIGPAGYCVAFAIASSNLKLGNIVVADSVNPVRESRQGWRDRVRDAAGARLLEIEIVCSDLVEHRRRVESRQPDIDGFKLPDWSAIRSRDYVPWTSPRLIIDTAVECVDIAISRIEQEME